jgi:hypothetical protein
MLSPEGPRQQPEALLAFFSNIGLDRNSIIPIEAAFREFGIDQVRRDRLIDTRVE